MYKCIVISNVMFTVDVNIECSESVTFFKYKLLYSEISNNFYN